VGGTFDAVGGTAMVGALVVGTVVADGAAVGAPDAGLTVIETAAGSLGNPAVLKARTEMMCVPATAFQV